MQPQPCPQALRSFRNLIKDMLPLDTQQIWIFLALTKAVEQSQLVFTCLIKSYVVNNLKDDLGHALCFNIIAHYFTKSITQLYLGRSNQGSFNLDLHIPKGDIDPWKVSPG